MPPQWPHGDPETVARSVTAQPAYRVAPATSSAPTTSFWEALVDYLGRLFHPFFTWLHGAAGSAGPAGVVIGFAVLALVFAGLAYLVMRIVGALANGPRGAGAAGRARAGALAATRTAAEWRARADSAAAGGDFAAAVAALFMAALLDLDERGLVAFDAARTPGEYRRLLRRAAAGTADAFDRLADAFVRAAFAGVAVEAADYVGARSAYEALWPHAA